MALNAVPRREHAMSTEARPVGLPRGCRRTAPQRQTFLFVVSWDVTMSVTSCLDLPPSTSVSLSTCPSHACVRHAGRLHAPCLMPLASTALPPHLHLLPYHAQRCDPPACHRRRRHHNGCSNKHCVTVRGPCLGTVHDTITEPYRNQTALPEKLRIPSVYQTATQNVTRD